MDIGIPPKVTFPTIRNPSPIDDGDVGQKGNSYYRKSRKNKQQPLEPPQGQTSGSQESDHTIDIHI